MVRTAARAVAFEDFHVRITETLEALAPKLDQIVLALDADRFPGDAADHRGRVSGARAHVEHRVAGLIPAAWIISATMYGCEIVCPASIGSGWSP